MQTEISIKENQKGLKTNLEGMELIKHFEGLKLHSYLDQAGVWTIGYGSTENVKPYQQITEGEALARLIAKVRKTERFVLSCVKAPLNANEFSALVCFSYNLGIMALECSELLKLLNEGRRLDAADQFLKWDHVKGLKVEGLTRRREAERALFLKPVIH